MSNQKIIVPEFMELLVKRAGYIPAVMVNETVYCAGQVGRTPDFDIIEVPGNQFVAAWEIFGQCQKRPTATQKPVQAFMNPLRHFRLSNRAKTPVQQLVRASGRARTKTGGIRPGVVFRGNRCVRGGDRLPARAIAESVPSGRCRTNHVSSGECASSYPHTNETG